jgi:hypothetical protein
MERPNSLAGQQIDPAARKKSREISAKNLVKPQ